MKRHGLILLLLVLPLFALWGCEGDQGPAGPAGADGADGADGVDGVDGNVTCLDCHNTDLLDSISLQYDRSQHGLGDIAVDYAGGRGSCAECHSGNGYVEWANTGDVDANFTTPEPFTCGTCHGVHTTFEETDYALRVADPVVWLFDGATYDFEDNSNVCAWCHQSRRAEPNTTNPGSTFVITSTHYGPHHGAQSNVLAGEGFAEIAGSMAYPTTFGHPTSDYTCVGCHMGDYNEGTGGHTFLPNIQACTGCHSSAEDFSDIGSVQSDIHDMLDQLRDLLLAQGVIVEDDEDPGHYIPLLDDPDVDDWDGDDNTTELFAYVTMEQAQAFFNWVGLYEDRSNGMHNPEYVEALLTNSIEALSD
jgi:hypothetical protein